MNESEKGTIYEHLSLKDTGELLGYWQKHDEDEWTAAAFAVMEKILIERLGELPSKDEIDELIVEMEEPEEDSNPYTELKTLINDNDPVFYEPNKVTLLIKWIFRALKIVIILYIIQFIFNNIRLFSMVVDQDYGIMSVLFDLILNFVGLLLAILVIFIQYKALGYVLKMLKEMEINSRNL